MAKASALTLARRARFGMRVDLLKRADLTAGICGAKWLKKHATGVLATAAASCKNK